MELRNKQFPYPVLSEYSDDYPDDYFKTEVTVKLEGYKLHLMFSSECTNHDLNALIENELASFTYMLECSATGFRKAVQTFKPVFTVILDTRDLSGRLRITSLITASQNLSGFSSEGFHEDYSGLVFDIDQGCILGMGQQIDINIDKSSEDLGDTESIFSITKLLDETELGMRVEYQDSEKIVIYLPVEMFNTYVHLNMSEQLKEILNSMVIFPALVFVLTSLDSESNAEETRIEYDSKWYRTLEKMLKDKFDLEISQKSFTEINKIDLAQKLLGYPLGPSLNELYNPAINDEDEDQL